MARFVKGDVVVVPFPFSDLTHAKRRPALVLAEFEGDDLLLCQITSQQFRDRHAVAVDGGDFETGALRQRSYVRPTRLFTADRQIVLYQAGHLRAEKVSEVVGKIISLLQR